MATFSLSDSVSCCATMFRKPGATETLRVWLPLMAESVRSQGPAFPCEDLRGGKRKIDDQGKVSHCATRPQRAMMDKQARVSVVDRERSRAAVGIHGAHKKWLRAGLVFGMVGRFQSAGNTLWSGGWRHEGSAAATDALQTSSISATEVCHVFFGAQRLFRWSSATRITGGGGKARRRELATSRPAITWAPARA